MHLFDILAATSVLAIFLWLVARVVGSVQRRAFRQLMGEGSQNIPRQLVTHSKPDSNKNLGACRVKPINISVARLLH